MWMNTLSCSERPNAMIDATMARFSVSHQERYYVYALAYPQDYYDKGNDLSGIVFYIGKGTDNRIDSHEIEAGETGKDCFFKKRKGNQTSWDEWKRRKK